MSEEVKVPYDKPIWLWLLCAVVYNALVSSAIRIVTDYETNVFDWWQGTLLWVVTVPVWWKGANDTCRWYNRRKLRKNDDEAPRS